MNASLNGQIATVQVSQTFVNTGKTQLETSFLFPLPYDGAIDSLTLMVGNKEYQAELLSKEEARQRYERIVRSNKDPALLEWIGTGMFQTSVFPIPPGEKRTVTLRFTQLCRASHGQTDFLFPLSTAKYTAKPLDRLKVRVAINSRAPLTNIYSGTHEVKIERTGEKQAVVTLEQKNVIPSSDFRLFFDSATADVGASLLSYKPRSDETQPGYFLLLASPKIQQSDDANATPKTVVFVVDRSGSMSGKKIEQAREALKFVLNNLRDGDLFNIVAYDSNISTFRPELEKFNDATRDEALGFVNSLFAGGSTNIDGALTKALGMLKRGKSENGQRPSYVIFLTDGLPTVGEQNEAKIAVHAATVNQTRARVFSFGVGYDVNSRLLDKLAAENHGQSEYVRPNEDIEAAVSKLYNRIGTPVMTDVVLKIDVEGADSDVISRLYPSGNFDLFAGDQTVIVGRYTNGGPARVSLSGKLAGEAKTIEFPAELVAESNDDSNSFVAKLWATRRVGEIIDEIDLHGKNQELIDELVALATEHGILTPYTSFLADENSDVRAVGQNVAQAEERLTELEAVADEFGVNQRAAKQGFKNARSAPAFGYGGGGGGYGGEFGEADLDSLSTSGGRGTVYYDAKTNRQRIANNVFSLGRKTFFRRGERWVDSTVTEEEEKQAETIERFSPEYFELAERLGKRATPYLAIEDEVVVKLEGVVYAW